MSITSDDANESGTVPSFEEVMDALTQPVEVSIETTDFGFHFLMGTLEAATLIDANRQANQIKLHLAELYPELQEWAIETGAHPGGDETPVTLEFELTRLGFLGFMAGLSQGTILLPEEPSRVVDEMFLELDLEHHEVRDELEELAIVIDHHYRDEFQGLDLPVFPDQ